MEYFMSFDSVVALITGAIIGGLAGQVIKGLGLVGNIVTGIVGGLIGGLIFDSLDFMNTGDITDPAIAGLVGAVILLAIVGVGRRYAKGSGRVRTG